MTNQEEYRRIQETITRSGVQDSNTLLLTFIAECLAKIADSLEENNMLKSGDPRWEQNIPNTVGELTNDKKYH